VSAYERPVKEGTVERTEGQKELQYVRGEARIMDAEGEATTFWLAEPRLHYQSLVV